jgi:poly(A) polymerase Pap1
MKYTRKELELLKAHLTTFSSETKFNDSKVCFSVLKALRKVDKLTEEFGVMSEVVKMSFEEQYGKLDLQALQLNPKLFLETQIKLEEFANSLPEYVEYMNEEIDVEIETIHISQLENSVFNPLLASHLITLKFIEE